ncbi:hypothetical protein C7H19_09120 [Aphanothece hegewaldii CCALA 016]|uniref:Uncharacterized protein n=1 Tax=Aphanothece hegewaldii CCALA 016 TaxID=2107694 RepID=A0A2T1LZ92_9CHRO|nr:hypothetical protein [Aphanothece hegewaldii]PSF37703.1 hypothetical protein C7H19_09120 [Aphanothece hegewaldii CCALA 016]
MKPDFEQMSKAELKSYVLSHKNDDEAFYKLVDRWKGESQNSLGYPCPKTPEDIEKMKQTIKEKIRQIEEQA